MHTMQPHRTFVAAAIMAAAFFAVLPSGVSAADPTDIAQSSWNTGSIPAPARRFAPFSATQAAGSLAIGDLGTDGEAEIVVGAQAGAAPVVRVFRGDGTRIIEFPAYGAGMKQGVIVAVGDLDGDNVNEIVTVSGAGGPAHVVVYSANGKMKIIAGGFFPYGTGVSGVTSIALADLDGDGKDEIITSAGPGGGPQVKIWSGKGVLIGEFPAFDTSELFGRATVAAGDLDADGKAEIVVSIGGSQGLLRVFEGITRSKLGEFAANGDGFHAGFGIAVADADGDSRNDIIVGTNGGGGPQVSIFNYYGTLGTRFSPYDASYGGGVLVGAGRFAAGQSIVALPVGTVVDGRPDLAKYIHVDVSEQKLKAFEYGRLTKTILVATGMAAHPTPVGEFSILEKPLFVNYRWFYGPGNPENYDLGNVKWNLRFFPHIYIHYAPWRSVFGIRGSHGCVNVNKANAEWIYNWADVGTPVTVTL